MPRSRRQNVVNCASAMRLAPRYRLLPGTSRRRGRAYVFLRNLANVPSSKTKKRDLCRSEELLLSLRDPFRRFLCAARILLQHPPLREEIVFRDAHRVLEEASEVLEHADFAT